MTAERQGARWRPATRQLVFSAMETLSIEHRQVLLECHFCGSSVAEAAETLGVPADTVKSRTYYALRNLRLAIDAMGGAPVVHPTVIEPIGKAGER